jgi:hypothetical protein
MIFPKCCRFSAGIALGHCDAENPNHAEIAALPEPRNELPPLHPCNLEPIAGCCSALVRIWPSADHSVCRAISGTGENRLKMRSRPFVNRQDLTCESLAKGRRSIRKSAMTPPVKSYAAHSYPHRRREERIGQRYTSHTARGRSLSLFWIPTCGNGVRQPWRRPQAASRAASR